MLEETLDLFSPHYKIIRSKRRTLGIIVKDAHVEVRAPLKAPQYWIEEFIQEKMSWIEEKVEEQRKQQQEIYRLDNNAVISILDIPHQISLVEGKTNKVFAQNADNHLHNTNNSQQLCIQLKKTDDNFTQQKLLYKKFNEWLKQQAEEYMSAYSIKVHEKLCSYVTPRITLKAFQYRITKSKWGHCTSEGVIQYNPLILLAPKFVAHYIVAHEVCHLHHANHSKSYWKLVDKITPDRVSAENWLSNHGHKLALYKNID